jgi:two-component system, sensor histidine kinase and response regulator
MSLTPEPFVSHSILVVEDSPTQGEWLKHMLESRGYEVRLVFSAPDALTLLRQWRPSLILSDVIMPEMDGFQFCQQIKLDRDLRSIPVVLLTTLSDPKDVIRGLECAADNFIVKPVNEEYLFARLQYVISNRKTVEQRWDSGVEIVLEGRKYVIDSDRRQILDLLLSTYEAAVRKNEELVMAKDELKQLNDRLERTVQERTVALLDTNQQLESFCYSVAHDLRAPVRAMQGFAQMLAEDYQNSLDETGLDVAHRIQRAALRMDQLILELLEFSRLSQMELSMRPVELHPLVESALNELRGEILERGAIVEITSPLPAVRGHGPVLEQVLANLISNAIKFVEKGTAPHARISAEVRGRRVRVLVTDNGLGIAPEYQAKVFGLFERLHHNGEFPGTGAGLAIVQRCVHRMGGAVGLESTPGKGSTFWFEMPAAGE